MKYKISQHLLILYSLTEPSDLMWLRLKIAILISVKHLRDRGIFIQDQSVISVL